MNGRKSYARGEDTGRESPSAIMLVAMSAHAAFVFVRSRAFIQRVRQPRSSVVSDTIWLCTLPV